MKTEFLEKETAKPNDKINEAGGLAAICRARSAVKPDHAMVPKRHCVG